MKNFFKLLALGVFVLLFRANAAFGQFVITADENGNGTFSFAGGPPMAMPFAVGPDPISGIVTLFYILPFPAIGGDLAITEFGNSGPSDVIRFNGQNMFFFSLIDDGSPPSLADVPVLPVLLPGAVMMVEVGTEGANGVVYIPTSVQPGSPGGPTAIYNILSDVPEPSTWMLCILGGAGLFALAWQRRTNHR